MDFSQTGSNSGVSLNQSVDWVSPYHDCEHLIAPEFEISLVKGEFFNSLLRRDTGELGSSGSINIPMIRRAGENPDCMAFVLHYREYALAGLYVQNALRDGTNNLNLQALCAFSNLHSSPILMLFVKSCLEYLKKCFPVYQFNFQLEGSHILRPSDLNLLKTVAGVGDQSLDPRDFLQAYLEKPVRVRSMKQSNGFQALETMHKIKRIESNLFQLPVARNVEFYKGLHKGGRVFILASGPSLQECDLSKLRGERVIVVNRSLLAYPQADYTVSMAEHAFANFGDLLARSRVLFTTNDRPFGTKMPTLGIDGFSYDLAQGVYTGDTVSIVALQVAVYLGFRSVHFVGLDLKNSSTNTHFFGRDPLNVNHDQTEFPRMKKAFEKVMAELRPKGYRITNSSPVCELDCFEKIPFPAFFEN